MLEGLVALGDCLIRAAAKSGKPGKHLRRSIDALAASIADGGSRLAATGPGIRPHQG